MPESRAAAVRAPERWLRPGALRRAVVAAALVAAAGLAGAAAAPAPTAPGPAPKPGAIPSGAQELPDIYGPGAVLRSGAVHMKVTNFGHVGNIHTNLSSDPAGQWPGASGVEYLHSISLAVGARDPLTADPALERRVSYLFNWRPPTLDPEDRIYRTGEGAPSGARFVNDDGDLAPATGRPRIDEDFLDGRDNDGDGMVDEDFASLGDTLFSCVMRDDTPQAINAEPGYVPLGLECRQLAWSWARPGFDDYCVVEYTILNRSGHTLDSVYVGWAVDMDCGPFDVSDYFMDDRDAPGFPGGEFTLVLPEGDARRQHPHHPALDARVSPDSALCPRLPVRINGFAVTDDDGDSGRTPGAAAFLLVDHTVDPLGFSAPRRVGFRSFRSFVRGTPYASGGNPMTPAQRYAFMSGAENVDPATGFIAATPGASAADYAQWCSIGPFRNLPAGGSVRATIAFAVQRGGHASLSQYAADYSDYQAGTLGGRELLARHPLLRVAFDAQLAYEGFHEARDGFAVPDFHGRESVIELPPGSPPVFVVEDCTAVGGDWRSAVVTDLAPAWFDFDCDFCTGVWDYPAQRGLFHHTWAVPGPLFADAPEPVVARGGDLAVSPNPARGRARLEFEMPGPASVQVDVHDPAGRRVRSLIRGPLSAGAQWIEWDLADDRGRAVRPGLYFFRVSTGGVERRARAIVVE